jgi:hypothetical protein
LEKLFSAHANSLAYTVGREERVDCLVVEFQPSVGSRIQIYGQASGVVAPILFQINLVKAFDQLLRIFGVEEAAKLFSLVDLMKEKFGLASKLLVSKRRELTQAVLESIKIRRTIFVEFHKPRPLFSDNSLHLEFVFLEKIFDLTVIRSNNSSGNTNAITKRNRAPENSQTKTIFLGECTPNSVKDFLNRW